MEQKLLFYLMLMTVSIGIHMNILEMICGDSRIDIPCEILGICTLVYVNQYFTDEGPFHLSRSG